MTFELVPFQLEDFFLEHEHRADVINLASSDALPWTLHEVLDRSSDLKHDLSALSLQYPDVEAVLHPALERFCRPPAGMGVLATSGAAGAIFLVFALLRSEYAMPIRVAIPKPGYGAFDGIARLLGYEIVHYSYVPDNGWSIDIDGLRRVCEDCQLVVINNPHNPTGSVIDRGTLSELARSVRTNGGTMLVDEVFRLPDDVDSATSVGNGLIVIGSLSKVYGLPGLRLGWIAAEEHRIGRLRSLLQYATLSVGSFAALLGGFVLDNIELFSRRELLQNNRRIVSEWAAQFGDLLVLAPSAAGTTAVLEFKVDQSQREEALFDAFLQNEVLLVPGFRCFGVEHRKAWFRLGYGTDEATLRDGLSRITYTLLRFERPG